MKDIARMEASIDRFAKQAEKVREELCRGQKRYEEAVKNISKLRKECEESKCANILLHYIQGKDYQVDLCKKTIKHNHIDTINSLYHAELERLRESLVLGCKTIQRNYLVLRANNLVDSELQESLRHFVQLNNGQRNVKFENEKEVDEKEWIDISFDGNLDTENNPMAGLKRVHSEDNNEKERHSNRKLFKREEQCMENDIEKDMVELDVKPTITLNDTHVIIPGQRELCVDANATFQLPSCSQNKEMIRGILMEQNANFSNRTALNKALVKSNIGPQKIINKVSYAVSKDNTKKFSPSKIRKSPRPTSRTVTNRALASAANFINRQRTKSQTTNGEQENKFIGINRTASIRMKKPPPPVE